MGRVVFFIVVIPIIVLDFLMAGAIFAKGKKTDKYLGISLMLSAIIAASYLVSVITSNYFVTSLFSGFNFLSISIVLMVFLEYIVGYTKIKLGKLRLPIVILGWLLVTFDSIVQLINPFHEISIHYIYSEGHNMLWQYQPMLLYKVHLVICYVLLTLILLCLTYRTLKIPRIYRNKYLSVFAGVLVAVASYALYLGFHKEDAFDYSVIIYSVICFYLFWNRFYYSSHGMLTAVREMVLDELDNPVLLFDRDGEFSLCNTLGEQYITEKEKETLSFSGFVDKYGFSPDIIETSKDVHFQWNRNIDGKQNIYRVDVKCFRDSKENVIGKLLVFTDNSLEMDLLTGFHSKNSFEGYCKNELAAAEYPVAVAVCDLNKLTNINRVMGMEMGDVAIRTLADLMVKYCPNNAYFARLEDANLLAICQNTDNKKMRGYLEKIRDELEGIEGFSQKLEMQSAVSEATLEKPNILDAVETSMFSVRSQKLMDGGSAHSSLLDSLAQTLLESDSTTEEHVKRTRNMGELLGKRMGFTDIQQSNLALLCLLHDIGKLGIPMEILNKPGKLNSAEWDVMKSHADKGYRIAKASSELEEIADLILHHHESWNGKGYPDGLKQEAIPLLSRVIAVVDTYDAMTNDRPYHKAVSDMEAREELRRCAGVQFDPNIVNEFLALLDEITPSSKKEEKTTENGKLDVISNDSEEREIIQQPRGVGEIFDRSAVSNNAYPLAYTKYVLDENETIIEIDEMFEDLTGYAKEDLEKYHLGQWDLIPPEDKTYYQSMVRELIMQDNKAYLEHRILRKDGSIRNVICLGQLGFDSVTRQARTEIIAFDVSMSAAVISAKRAEREIAQRTMERWEAMTRKDSLTGLLNHESFINDVETLLLKDNPRTILIILDVDNFKEYNDTYGHFEGDKLLTLVAAMLEKSVEEFGFAGRLGGDEFAAVISVPPHIGDDGIEALVANSHQIVSGAIGALEKSATVSMGASFISGITSFNKMYQATDKALYRAKKKGRKCYSF